VIIKELRDSDDEEVPPNDNEEDASSSTRGPMSLPELCQQDVMQKMVENPATRARMNDPSFVEFARAIQAKDSATSHDTVFLLTACAPRVQGNPAVLQAAVARIDPRAVMILAALADTAVDVTSYDMDEARAAGSVDPSIDVDAEVDALKEPAAAKELGTVRFGDQDFRGAIRAYVRAISLCKQGASTTGLGPWGVAALHGNTAMCALKVQEWRMAIRHCGDSLKIAPRYTKVYLRRAQASRTTHDPTPPFLCFALAFSSSRFSRQRPRPDPPPCDPLQARRALKLFSDALADLDLAIECAAEDGTEALAHEA